MNQKSDRPSENAPFITHAQMAVLLNVTGEEIRQWRQATRLPCRKTARTVVFGGPPGPSETGKAGPAADAEADAEATPTAMG